MYPDFDAEVYAPGPTVAHTALVYGCGESTMHCRCRPFPKLEKLYNEMLQERHSAAPALRPLAARVASATPC